MKRLMIVRHGESEWNAGRLLQGQADIGLSPLGKAQAEALAASVQRLSPDRVITSDLKRARDTAAILGFPNAILTPELREISVGDWTGQSIADLKAGNLSAYLGWRAGSHTPPNGEVWSDFVKRTTDCITDALASSERLLAVCHGGVIRALMESLIGLSPERVIPVGPASLSILAQRGGENGAMRLEVFNFAPEGPILDAPD